MAKDVDDAQCAGEVKVYLVSKGFRYISSSPCD
jgi:hypothetical protein